MWTPWKMLCNGFDPEIPQWKTYSAITFLKIQPTSTQQVTIHHPIFSWTPRTSIHPSCQGWASSILPSYHQGPSEVPPSWQHSLVLGISGSLLLRRQTGCSLEMKGYRYDHPNCVLIDTFWMVQLANAKGNHKILWERQLQVTTTTWMGQRRKAASKQELTLQQEMTTTQAVSVDLSLFQHRFWEVLIHASAHDSFWIAQRMPRSDSSWCCLLLALPGRVTALSTSRWAVLEIVRVIESFPWS